MSKTAAALSSQTNAHEATTTTDSHAFDRLVSKLPQNTENLSVGRELLDTTWRMTVPVIIFASIGIVIDIALGSKPWVTILGTIIGFYFATLLVKRQIMRSDDTADTSDTDKVSPQ